MKNIILFIYLSAFFTACDPLETQIKAIKNTSNDTLIVIVIQKDRRDTSIIIPSEQKDIIYLESIGQSPEVSCSSIGDSDSLYISTKSKKELVKDLKDDKNWVSEFNSKFGSFQKCVFEIFDKDLK